MRKSKIAIVLFILIISLLILSSCSIVKFPVYLYGLIDTEGNYIVEPTFTGIKIGKEGLYPIRQGYNEYYKWGFCDRTGEVVIEPQYKDASMFSEGYAPVKLYDDESLWVFIDKDNNIVFDKEFNYALPFSEGLACVQSSKRDATY
ncbi:MAG: WG repeat-containing protein, partial [Clostridia bacterium]|nr:WG repeat-containing protein [Clostridia bacterium]